jgi:hypothetical protein
VDWLQPKLEIDQRKEQEMPAVELDIHIDPEAELVRAWRIEELVRAGYTPEHAQELADLNYVDLHLATSLVRQGCSSELALRILV